MNKLRASAKGEQCSLRLICCNGNPETTVLAHIRIGHFGMGCKPPDTFAVYACSGCHDAIDGRTRISMMEKEMLERIICGLRETQDKFKEKGLMI